MKVLGYSSRTRERTNIKIPLRVTGRDNRIRCWTETSLIREATSCGIGFNLCRPVEPGRLLHLSCPMPRGLRSFDYFKTDYEVWGVVRYVLSKPSDDNCTQKYFLGVALTGKNPPVSYEQDPTTLYDIKPVRSPNGLWVLREKPRFNKHYVRSAERYQLTKEVTIEVLDEHGMTAQTGIGTTFDISTNGAAIHTELQVPRGSFLKIVSSENPVKILSLTRSCQPIEDGYNKLNIEFIDKTWTD